MNISPQARFNKKYADTIPAQELFEHEVSQATFRNLIQGSLTPIVRKDDSSAFEYSVSLAMAEAMKQLRGRIIKVIPVPQELLSQLSGLSDVQELMHGDNNMDDEEKSVLAERLSK